MTADIESRSLELALAAATWIDEQSLATPHGRLWSVTPGDQEVDLTLYRGAAGVAVFALELAAATGDDMWLRRAREAADAFLAPIDRDSVDAPGLYRGRLGLAFLLRSLSEATGDLRYDEAARDAVARVIGSATPCGAGLGWIEPIPFAEAFGVEGRTEIWDVSRGSAGIGLGLLWAHAQDLHEGALATAVAIGDRLVEVAAPADGGLRWPMMQRDVGWWAPNFSHGTAGVAFFLARLATAAGERRFLDASLAGAAHLTAIATVDGPARCVHHSEGRGETLFYLGWCHGPPGTARLFHELAEATGDDAWRAWAVGGGDALLHHGAPAQRSRGYWDNVGQCCGDAAVGELALSLWESAGEPRFLELARSVGRHLDARAESGERGSCWPQCEHRVRPELVEAQTGYMQGAAGVGSFLLHLWAAGSGLRTKLRLPDDPF